MRSNIVSFGDALGCLAADKGRGMRRSQIRVSQRMWPHLPLFHRQFVVLLVCFAVAAVGSAGAVTSASAASSPEASASQLRDGATSSGDRSKTTRKRRSIPAPCQAAFPNARSKTIGKTTWHNRQQSVRMVLCARFGLEPSADFPISAGMVCGVLAQVIGRGSENLGLFVDGSCSGAELASDPKEPTKYIGIACGWAADLLGKLVKPLGALGSAGCTLAPSAGHALGGALESKHEFDVAVDVIRRGKCIKYSPTHFGSPWLAEGCARGDKGFKALPVYRPEAPSPVLPSPGGSAPTGGSGPTGGGSGGPPSDGPGPGKTFMGLPVIQISMGSTHACALQNNGIPYCWGTNDYGEAEPPDEPMVELTSGLEFSCGLRPTGTIVCWGDEGWPIKADIPSGSFTQVTAGQFNVCALRSSGDAVCWGSNVEGQSNPPPGPFTRVDAGGETTCGLRPSGEIVCWGWNNKGQTESPSGSFTALSAGTFTACGIRIDASVACWGSDQNEAASPPAGSFGEVSIGEEMSCGLRTNGTVFCWGGIFNTVETEEKMSGEFTQISAGPSVVCGLTPEATIKCAGGPDFWGLEDPPQ